MEAGVERSSSDLDFVHVFNDALHMFAQQSFFFFFCILSARFILFNSNY